jgi:hypothetical protein
MFFGLCECASRMMAPVRRPADYDIDGPRSVRFAERHDAARRGDIKVGDIMTEWAELPTLDWQTVQTSKISDLVEIFEGIGVMHLLVVESDANGAEVVRGLISRSRVERQLHASEPHSSAAGGELRIQRNAAVQDARAVSATRPMPEGSRMR